MRQKMGTEQAALHSVKLTRGAKGEKRWEAEASGMTPELAVERVLKMDRMLTEAIYPEDLKEEEEDAGV